MIRKLQSKVQLFLIAIIFPSTVLYTPTKMQDAEDAAQ